jgi:hypothetical protein
MSEYKVNPHVRNKQALDMDLVLVCAKRSVPFDPLSLSLDEVVQRTMESLPLEASNGSRNRLFLHFMGELLKAASAGWDTHRVTYEWFNEALTQFDDLMARNVQTDREDRTDKAQTAIQLRLF